VLGASMFDLAVGEAAFLKLAPQITSVVWPTRY